MSARRRDPLALPDEPRASIMRLATRKPEKVGYAMDPTFLTQINRKFLRDRAITRQGPLSLDEALELLRQKKGKEKDWYTVLDLRTVHDLPQREVAAELNISQSTVSRYEQKALAFLNKHVHEGVTLEAVAVVANAS